MQIICIPLGAYLCCKFTKDWSQGFSFDFKIANDSQHLIKGYERRAGDLLESCLLCSALAVLNMMGGTD